MHRKKTPKTKIKQKQKLLFVCSTLLLAILLFFFCVCIYKVFANSYHIKSRINNISLEQEKDDENIKTVAWIRVQGTNIDYPVIYAPNYDFSDKVDDFAWTEVNYTGLNNIVFVSGHNIKNLSRNPVIGDEKHSRFEQLMAYTYYDFVKKNQFIQYTVGGKDYLYKVYSVSYEDAYNLDHYNAKPYDKDRMDKYIKDTRLKSIFDFDVDVKNTDKIISLDTCTRMYGNTSRFHFRVNGRLLRKGEMAKLSKVVPSTKYEEIEKIMKGDNNYEKTQ